MSQKENKLILYKDDEGKLSGETECKYSVC